jgi:hypothetical protein
MNIAAKGGKYIFQSFFLFAAFAIIQNNARLRIDTRKIKREKETLFVRC